MAVAEIWLGKGPVGTRRKIPTGGAPAAMQRAPTRWFRSPGERAQNTMPNSSRFCLNCWTEQFLINYVATIKIFVNMLRDLQES